MKRFLKWFLIVGAAGVVLLASAILVIPLIYDAEDFKPQIQSMLSNAAGRPVKLAGDIGFSIFPWTGFSIAGIEIENPQGFSERHFLTVKSFDIKVALIPLLSKDIQVRHVRMESPRLVLETTGDGRSNWEDLGKSPDAEPAETTPSAPSGDKGPLQVKAFKVDEITVSGGETIWIDRGAEVRKTLSNMDLRLENISLASPIRLAFSARLDGDPISIQGSVGPVGDPPGAAPLPLDLTVAALEVLTVHLKGNADPSAATPSFQASIELDPFSPKKLADRLGQPLKTSDPDALKRLSLTADVKGDAGSAALSNGRLTLDDANLDFSLTVQRFDRPDIRFDMRLDDINLDRYLPPASAETPETDAASSPSSTPPDRAALRRLLLSGTAHIDRLAVSGGEFRDIGLTVSAKDGVFTLDPLDLALYGGTLHATAAADLREATPRSRVQATMNGVSMGPLLVAFAGKDILAGTGSGAVSLRTAGDTQELVKRHLNGNGDLLFTDGAIKGVDLTRMVQNAKSLLTLEKQPPLLGRTDFSEFKSMFTIDDGVVTVSEASLTAPLMRFNARGKADLTDETLDFRAEPKIVASLQGKGDEKKRSGFEIPLLITGGFDDPKIRPDPAALLRQIEDLPASIEKSKSEIEKQLEEKKGQLDAILKRKKPEEEGKNAQPSKEETVSDFLKKLPFGQ